MGKKIKTMSCKLKFIDSDNLTELIHKTKCK